MKIFFGGVSAMKSSCLCTRLPVGVNVSFCYVREEMRFHQEPKDFVFSHLSTPPFAPPPLPRGFLASVAFDID